MTAPSTFNLTGTFTEPNGAASTGRIRVRPTDNRFKNGTTGGASNVIDAQVTEVVLDGSGTIGTVVLVQATNGYDVTELRDGHLPKTYHIAGTANLSITPTATPMTVTGTYYDCDGTTAAGTVELVDLDTGDTYIGTLSAGALSKAVWQNTLGYNVTEKIVGRAATPSYHIAGSGAINLGTV